jgi:hypothetical protein
VGADILTLLKLNVLKLWQQGGDGLKTGRNAKEKEEKREEE